MRPSSKLGLPYLKFNWIQKVFEVLSRRENCFALALQAEAFGEASGAVS